MVVLGVPDSVRRFRQLAESVIALSRAVICVILVARCGQRQAVADYDGEGRSRAGTVGIADHVGQGGGSRRARCAGQYACVGVKVQTRHTGQSVGQWLRAAARFRQFQIGDRRVLCVILVASCTECQAGVDRDREVHTRAGTVFIHDLVGQGGGTDLGRRAGQRACAGVKVQTRHTGQSVGQWRVPGVKPVLVGRRSLSAVADR